MKKKISEGKIFSDKKKRLFALLIILFLGASALGASIFLSFKKQQEKNAPKKEVVEQETEIKVLKPFNRANMQEVNIYDNMGSVNPFDSALSGALPSAPVSSDGLLVLPPLGGVQNSSAGAVMSTTVSGIMYDPYSPSAIINIEGSEYFVKNNDVVNQYKILSIAPKKVVVKYDNNIYQAGVGEIFSQVESNSNIVNLNKKFGGNVQDGIPINIRKR